MPKTKKKSPNFSTIIDTDSDTNSDSSDTDSKTDSQIDDTETNRFDMETKVITLKKELFKHIHKKHNTFINNIDFDIDFILDDTVYGDAYGDLRAYETIFTFMDQFQKHLNDNENRIDKSLHAQYNKTVAKQLKKPMLHIVTKFTYEKFIHIIMKLKENLIIQLKTDYENLNFSDTNHPDFLNSLREHLYLIEYDDDNNSTNIDIDELKSKLNELDEHNSILIKLNDQYKIIQELEQELEQEMKQKRKEKKQTSSKSKQSRKQKRKSLSDNDHLSMIQHELPPSTNCIFYNSQCDNSKSHSKKKSNILPTPFKKLDNEGFFSHLFR
jgi:hypothetical protein